MGAVYWLSVAMFLAAEGYFIGVWLGCIKLPVSAP